MAGLIALLCTLVLVRLVRTMDVALFASSGCYSHDVMMKEVGHEFEGHNVSWLQARIYEFEASSVELPSKWNKIMLNRAERAGREIRQSGSALLWQMNIPMDHSTPWDLRGSLLLFEIMRLHHRYCGEFVRSLGFKQYVQSARTDLVIVDHFIQECFVAASSLLNSTSVMFSNWPIADGYITAIGVPANPSSVPKIGTMYSSLRMSFVERVRNTVFHSFIAMARQLQAWFVNRFYTQWGYHNLDLDQIQAKHLLYAGRSEFLAEAIRPLTNRVKHFGCVRCRQKADFQIRPPAVYALSQPDTPTYKSHELLLCRKSHFSPRLPIVLSLRRNTTDLRPTLGLEPEELCARKCARQQPPLSITSIRAEHPFYQTNSHSLSTVLTPMERRYMQTQAAFKELNLALLDAGLFVLVSFGSVAETKFMPTHLLDQFLHTFRTMTSLRFVWQINCEPEELIGKRKVPGNLILLKWAPVKILLAHPNLHYAILHGGINSINEVLFFGVPVLGVPLQGDQVSNLQRLVELGMAEMSTIRELHSPGHFLRILQQFEAKLPRLRPTARKVSRMIADYRGLNGGQQTFWLHWAYRHGRRLQSADSTGTKRRYFRQDVQDSIDYFSLKEISVWLALIGLLLFCLTK